MSTETTTTGIDIDRLKARMVELNEQLDGITNGRWLLIRTRLGLTADQISDDTTVQWMVLAHEQLRDERGGAEVWDEILGWSTRQTTDYLGITEARSEDAPTAPELALISSEVEAQKSGDGGGAGSDGAPDRDHLPGPSDQQS